MNIQETFELACEHHKAGRLAQAELLYREVLAAEPRHSDTLHMLGVIAHQAGQNDVAVGLIRHAIAIQPKAFEYYSNLGEAYRAMSQLDLAIQAYRQAIALAPRNAPSYNNLGIALKEKGDLDAAIEAYQQAIQLDPDFAEPECNLGLALNLRGQSEEAAAHFQRAADRRPSFVAAHVGLSQTMNALVPYWHIPMMNDELRNDFYYSALKSVITSDSRVLEIGTGSGLLAMIAATLGARDVTTCEAMPLIAATARRVIAENELGERVRVIPRRSTEIQVNQDLPQAADTLIFEIFSNDFLGEGVLPSIEDAKRRLLKPNARMVPACGSIMIALFGGDDVASNLIVGDSRGFNLSHFNSIVPRSQSLARKDLAIDLLSDDVEVFRFDFVNDSVFPGEERLLRIPVKTAGRCLGIIQWIRLEMDKDLAFDNHPSKKAVASSWHHGVSIFPRPIDLLENQVVLVSAVHDRKNPWFSFKDVEET